MAQKLIAFANSLAAWIAPEWFDLEQDFNPERKD